jgi:2-pyrone-4,6-dicarboxylate lactonase
MPSNVGVKPALPPLSCCAHAHVFGPFERFPLARELDWTPPERPVEQYAQMLDSLGVARGVIVHSSSHGIDNRVTLDAIARMGGRCRGIALVAPSVTDRELEALAKGGMTGIRISTMLKGAIGAKDVQDLESRLGDLGWHVELHFDKADEIVPLEPMLRKLSIPVVFDHMARARGGAGVDQPGFRGLLRLLKDTDHCWAKVSSWYRLSDAGPPYDDMRRLFDALAEARADRLVWGSNWPHPLLKGPPPDDAELLAQFMQWAGDRARTMLVDNPAKLYGFE